MRAKRVTEWCARYLKDSQRATTGEMLDAYNEKFYHGTTSHGLGNVLRQDRRFIKAGETVINRGTGEYKVTVWALKKGWVFGNRITGERILQKINSKRRKKRAKKDLNNVIKLEEFF